MCAARWTRLAFSCLTSVYASLQVDPCEKSRRHGVLPFVVIQWQGNPYWDSIVDGLLNCFGPSLKDRLYRPKSMTEEAMYAKQIGGILSGKTFSGYKALVVALVQPGLKQRDGTFVGSCIGNAKACWKRNSGEAYRDLVKNGIDSFFIELGPSISAKNVHVISPDNYAGGRLVGEEFCSQPTGRGGRQIVVLKGPVGAPQCDSRIAGFKDILRMECSDEDQVVKEVHVRNWNRELAQGIVWTLLIEKPEINAIVACNDDMAEGAALAVGQRGLSARTFISGFDHRPSVEGFLRNRTVFVTVDQQVNIPTRGMLNDSAWKVFTLATGKVHTAQIPHRVNTTVAAFVPDMPSKVRNDILSGYNSEIPPAAHETFNGVGELNVSLSVHNFSVLQVDLQDEQSVTAVLFFERSWSDDRLSWDPRFFNGSIAFPAQEIWIPHLRLPGLKDHEDEEVSEADNFGGSAEVSPSGKVRYSVSLHVETDDVGFVCQTSVQMFPFDDHSCRLEFKPVTSAVHINLQAPAATDWEESLGKCFLGFFMSDAGWSGTSGNHFGRAFTLALTRNPMEIYITIIVPYYLLNWISFWQFYLPPSGAFLRLGLAITAILAAIALTQCADKPEGMGLVALEGFFFFSLFFHLLSLVISISSVASEVREPISERSDQFSEDRFRRYLAASLSFKDWCRMTIRDNIVNVRKAFGRRKLARASIVKILGSYVTNPWDRFGRRFVLPGYMMSVVCMQTYLKYSNETSRAYSKAGGVLDLLGFGLPLVALSGHVFAIVFFLYLKVVEGFDIWVELDLELRNELEAAIPSAELRERMLHTSSQEQDDEGKEISI